MARDCESSRGRESSGNDSSVGCGASADTRTADADVRNARLIHLTRDFFQTLSSQEETSHLSGNQLFYDRRSIIIRSNQLFSMLSPADRRAPKLLIVKCVEFVYPSGGSSCRHHVHRYELSRLEALETANVSLEGSCAP